MKSRVEMIPAPTSPQPGGYVRRAYPDQAHPQTPWVELETLRIAGDAEPRWEIVLRWPCPEPVREGGADTDRFVDAAALLVPTAPNVSWMTMGSPGLGVEGVLWRPDRPQLVEVRAEGLGTVERREARTGWQAEAEWTDALWQVRFQLAGWPKLEEHSLLALAVWRGASAERAGLKSVSPGWMEIAP